MCGWRTFRESLGRRGDSHEALAHVPHGLALLRMADDLNKRGIDSQRVLGDDVLKWLDDGRAFAMRYRLRGSQRDVREALGRLVAGWYGGDE